MPSDQTVEEVRELLDFIEENVTEIDDIDGPGIDATMSEDDLKLICALCRAYLAAQDAEDERPAPDLPQAIKDELFHQACLCADTEAAAQKQPCACRAAMLLEQIEQWGKSLTRPPAIDAEAIKREAVREFAEALRLSFRCRAEICRNSGLSDEHKFWELHAERELSEACNRKGINLQ